jgi:hypothetical protein
MWRSVSMASPLPSPIGRFGGSLDDDESVRLLAVAKQAVSEGSRTWMIAPDSPVDQIEVDGVDAVLGIHDSGEGAWKDLAGLLRPLLGELTYSPRAALSLQVNDEADLVHQGSESLQLDLSRLTVQTNHWRDGESLGSWVAPVQDLGEVESRPGWRLPLPFGHGFDVSPGDRLIVRVAFAAHDGDQLVPVGLQVE